MSSGANLGRTVTQTAMRWWQAWQRQARNDQPLENVANRRLVDAVLSRADLVSAREQVHRDMLHMMWYFSVDPGRVPPRFSGALRDAEQLCAHCLVVGRCQHWFHGRLSDDAPRSFCPNAELYEEIAVSQQQASDSNEPPTAIEQQLASRQRCVGSATRVDAPGVARAPAQLRRSDRAPG